MSPLRRSPALAGADIPCALLACALLAALVVPPAAGQEGEPGEDDWQPLDSFDEAISVELTDVEVWVTDRRGRPVTGLTAGDFVLREDGDPVEITHFSAHQAEESGSWAEPEPRPEPDRTPAAEVPAEEAGVAPALAASPEAAPEPDPQAAREAADAADAEQRVHLAILVDNWNLRPADRARVFDDLRVFLRERMDPRDRAMFLVHDRALTLVQELTDDPDELMATLARIERSAMANLQMESERRAAYRNIRDEYENARPIPGQPPDPCLAAWGGIQNAAHQYATAVVTHTQRSGGALASTGGMLAGIPGRRVLLYVGSGLPQQAGSEIFHYLLELCPHQSSQISTWFSNYDLTWLYEEVARQANANGLTLYAVEAKAPLTDDDISLPDLAGGMTTEGRVGRTIVTAGQTYRPSPATRRSAELDSEAGLFYVANETGGRAILNAADFASEFERLGTELRTYYSLGFRPGHGGDGRIHRLEVELRKGVGDGWRVRHRQSYHDKPYEQRMAERIRGVAQFGTESNRLDVRVETGEATATDAGHRVPIRLWVPLDEITFLEAEERGGTGGEGRLRVLMAVSDAAGELGPVRQKLVTVERSGEAAVPGAASGPGEHLVEVDLELSASYHVVALGLRDELGGDTSFLRHEIRLDDEAHGDETGPETGVENRR